MQFGAKYFVELPRTILVSSCGLKKKKSHYNSRVSLHEIVFLLFQVGEKVVFESSVSVYTLGYFLAWENQ